MQKLIITFILGLSILVAQDAKEVEKKDAPAKEEKADDTKKPADTKEADAKPDAESDLQQTQYQQQTSTT